MMKVGCGSGSHFSIYDLERAYFLEMAPIKKLKNNIILENKKKKMTGHHNINFVNNKHKELVLEEVLYYPFEKHPTLS